MDSNEENNRYDSSNNDTDHVPGVTNEVENAGWDANDLKYQHSSSDESDGEEEGSDYSSTDSDGLSEKCPICLQRFTGQEIGTPETCEHYFCLDCITKWSNKTATCPVDRKSFPSILVRQDLEGKVIRVQEVVFPNQDQNPDGEQYDFNQTYCEVCGLCDREDRLLLCDGCDLGYHLECLEPRLEYVPIEDWYCPQCQTSYRAPEAAPISSREASHRSVRVARTSQSIRILHSIARSTTGDLIMETTGMEDLRRSTASSRNSSRDTQVNQRRITKPRKRKRKSKRSSKRKTRSTGRTASGKRPSSIRRRLLQQLRIIPPRPGQVYVGLPNCRSTSSSVGTSTSSSTSSLSSQRYNAGITPLRLYDSYHDLESYNNSGDEGTGGEVSVAAQVHHRIGMPMRSKFGRSSVDITPASLSGSVDILGPILNRQFILHHDRNIHITRDGTLVPSMSTNNLMFQNSTIVKKSDRCENNNNESSFNTPNNNNVSPIKSGTNSHSNVNGPPVNGHRTLPSSGMNGYARQAPISPNGTSSASNVPSSFSNSESNNTDTSRGYTQPPIELSDGGSNSLVNRGLNFPSHNDNELFAGSHLPQFCKLSGVANDKPKSDDESNPRDGKLNSKLSQNSRKSVDSHSKHNNDSDDEYNIYSDIEEVPDVVVKDKKAWRKPSQDQESEKETNRDREKDSDSEMVIDEENPKIRCNSVDPEGTSRLNLSISDTRAVEVALNTAANFILKDPVSFPKVRDPIEEYGLPSPANIPLPDSPPPIRERPTEESLANEGFTALRQDTISMNAMNDKSARREEYDPSQPLDSSDEEEHSLNLTKQNNIRDDVPEVIEIEDENEEVEIITVAVPNAAPTQIPAHVVPPTNVIVKESEDDLNMIPMPPQDDYRRPTIQFSIPTRHRLLPISSLIKRQKGVMRKENKNGNPMSFQSEISKIFGDEKGEEGVAGDWSKLGDSVDELGKISLVAEIFGSDDEEGEPDSVGIGSRNLGGLGNIDAISNAELEPAVAKAEQSSEPEKIGELTPTASSTPISMMANSRWKTIAEPIPIPDQLSTPQIANVEELPNIAIMETNENSEEANEIEVVAVKEAEVVVLSEVSKPRSRELHQHHSEKANFENAKDLSADEGYTNKSNSSLESISDEDSFDSDSSAARTGNGVCHRSRRKKDSTGTKSRKRARSHSPSSNCEEGEIVDAPEKKKKKGKKKKSKKRKKSKDSRSPSVIEFSEKRVPDSHVRHSSSEELDHENKPVSWRKPSKSNKQRNYRDGKPKAEEKYFRESDKHREPSPRDRERRDRDKHGKEKSPARDVGNHSSEKAENKRSPELSKNHSSRSSKGHRYGSDRDRRSRSRSASKSRKDKHHDTTSSGRRVYSSRSESRNSATRYSRRHNRRSKSPIRLGHSRSLSRNSGKLRSHSPTFTKSRRRSRSDSRSRRSRRRRSLSTSSSHSVSSKRGKGRRKDRSAVDDRQKRKNKDKEKERERERERERDREREREKIKEKEKEKEKDKEKDKEKVEVREIKDKKKKRKRREKSVSPVKAIVADGDSIVVSLNFQKGKDSSSSNTNADQPNQNKNEDTSKRKGSKSKSSRSEDKHSGKPKLLKKTVLIDLEASPIQEQHIGVSPTVIVLSDDDECADSKSKEQITNNKHNEDKNSGVVGTNSSVGTGVETGESCSPYLHCQGVAADSTQVQPQSGGKTGDGFNASLSNSGSPDEGSNGSLMRNESVVTSTRGSVETTLPSEVESSINSCSPSSKAVKGKISSIFHTMSPSATTSVPLGSSPTYMNRNEAVSTPSTAPATHKQNGQPAPMASTSVGSILGKPVIGNIPGLFPSNTGTMAGGNVSIPSPIVIPTPPAPQLRFPAMNPSLLNSNMLVSVASAIYGPLLAARQQSSAVRNLQPTQMAANTLGNVIANKNSLQGSVLLPKNQNFHTFNNNRSNNVSIQPTGDGDSPFSPNSSEGDDLFEPPNDRGNLDSVSSSSKADKNSSSSNSAPLGGSQAGGNVSTSGGKAKSTLFDSLFGASPNKGVQHNKMQDRISKMKSGSHQKSKGHRQTVKKEVKLSEGELRLSEDVPTSAVELRVKEKFLKKLNRQERVVEEVKLSLKPHYSKKHITKDEYKEILRKAVPKICHNKSGEINPNKIKELVEAYVKKFRHSRKRD